MSFTTVDLPLVPVMAIHGGLNEWRDIQGNAWADNDQIRLQEALKPVFPKLKLDPSP